MYMCNLLKAYIILFLVVGPCYADVAKEKAYEGKRSKYQLSDLVLPSEVKGKGGGAIFYSAPTDGKVLIPINFWGHFGKTGLHYMPSDTTLVRGVTLAGGLRGDAVTDEVKVIRRDGDKINTFVFDRELRFY